MKNRTIITLIIIILSFSFPVVSTAQNYQEIWAKETRAVIVVMGLKITTDDERNELTDPSAGEGAIVSVSEKNGKTLEKETEEFAREFGAGGKFFSADFLVTLDSVYTISIRFKSGTVITVDDYKIPPSWKTHHYFHSTDGTKSPATVLRKEQDKESDLWCFVYSLYPLSNYKVVGGTQVK